MKDKKNVETITVFDLISYHVMTKRVKNNEIMYSLLPKLQLTIPQKECSFSSGFWLEKIENLHSNIWQLKAKEL